MLSPLQKKINAINPNRFVSPSGQIELLVICSRKKETLRVFIFILCPYFVTYFGFILRVLMCSILSSQIMFRSSGVYYNRFSHLLPIRLICDTWGLGIHLPCLIATLPYALILNLTLKIVLHARDDDESTS